MHTTSPRTGNTGISTPNEPGRINPNAPAACSVAANTTPCPPWLPIPWLPILNPSRIPPESPPLAAASTCTSSPQSKKHISPGTLLVRSALSSRYLPSSMPALDSPKRARSCAFPRSTPKRPPAPSSSPSRPAQPTPPPTPSVITLLPASRARRARSHTFRFSS